MAGTHYGTIVVGGGTMGTAAAYALAERGERTLVLEQFGHIHALGSHGGQTRVIRHAYAEGPAYVPLVVRADELWMELEAATERPGRIYHRVGALEMAAPGHHHVARAVESLAGYDIPFESLDAAEIRRRWPILTVPDDWTAGYGPRSGFIAVEEGMAAMAEVARRGGAEIRAHEPVIAWGATGSGAWAETAQGRYTADRLVISAGAWAGQALAGLGLPLQVLRKILWWLEVEQPELFAPERFPVFMTDTAVGEIYGFPIWGQPGLKIAKHTGGIPTSSPEALDREVRDEEKAEVLPMAQRLFPGVTGKVTSAVVCMYTMTPDGHFIVDRHPEHPNVAIAAGFSGHGFKFTPAIGELLAGLVLDPATQPLSLLSLARFQPGGPAVVPVGA